MNPCNFLLAGLLCLATASFGMSKSPKELPNYDKMWKEAQSFADKGQYKSALVISEEIYSLAKQEDNLTQWYKAFVYRLKWTVELEEDGWVEGIERAQQWYSESEGGIRGLLALEMAQQYHDYVQAYSYQIVQRNHIDNGASSSVSTWSEAKWMKEIIGLLNTSLEAQSELKLISLKDAKQVLNKTQNVDYRDLSLSDIALRKNISLASDVKWRIGNHQDTLNSYLQSLTESVTRRCSSLLDEQKYLDYLMLQYHWIERGIENLSSTNKSETIKRSIDDVKGKEAQGYAEYYQTISLLNEGGITKKQAHDKLSSIVKRYPDSFGAKYSAAYLYNTLEQKQLEFNSEAVWVPNKQHLVLLNYRNIKEAHVFLAKVPYGTHVNQQWNYQSRESFVKGLDFKKINKYRLPFTEDYEQHKVEIAIPAQELGEYVLVISEKDKVNTDQFAAWSFIHVSNLASMTLDNSGVVVDRTSGQAVTGATATYYQRTGNRNSAQLVEVSTSTTNSIGKYALSTLKNGSVTKYEINDDVLFLPNSRHYVYSRSWRSNNQVQASFFTDRAIYRPGQRIKFKVLFNSTQEIKKSLTTFHDDIIRLHDVNGKKVKEVSLSSNSYGVAYGEFVLHEEVLPGQFQLKSTNSRGTSVVNVEEYKRPQMKAEFISSAELRTLGDEITQKINVSTYYGVNIENAKVSYRITESEQYPYFYSGSLYRGCYWPIRNIAKEVASGEVVTNKEGEGIIVFKSEQSQDEYMGLRKNKNYNISVTITDETGESLDISKSIILTNSPYRIIGPSQIMGDPSEDINLELKILNYDGQEVNADVQLDYRKHNVPTRAPFIDRYWSTSEKVLMEESDFRRNFPRYSWEGESSIINWESNILDSKRISISKSVSLDLNKVFGNSGIYSIKVLDDDGQKVHETLIQLYNGQDNILSAGFDKDIIADKSPSLGANNWKILSKWAGVNVYTTDHEKEIKMGDHILSFNLRDKDRNRAYLSTAYIKDNRFYSSAQSIDWRFDQVLNLEIKDGWKNSYLPGESVDLVVQVTDKNGNPVESELIATVYDKSLDAYSKLNWPIGSLRYRSGYASSFRSNGFQLSPTNYFNYRRDQVGGGPTYHLPSLLHYSLIYNGRVLMRSAPEMMMKGNAMDQNAASSDALMVDEEIEMEPAGFRGEDDKGGNRNIRKDLTESPFFTKMIQTDQDGLAKLTFKNSEALSAWQLQLLAVSKDMKFTEVRNDFTTRKPILVEPFLTRFFHSGDQGQISARFSNLDSLNHGIATKLKLFVVGEQREVSDWIMGSPGNSIELASGENRVLSYSINIPSDFVGLIKYQLSADAGKLNDGQEGYIPVLENRTTVTEAHSIFLKGEEDYKGKVDDFAFNMLSSQMEPRVKIEVVDQPLWYVFKTLPYLQERENESITQLLNTWVVNSIGSYCLEEYPWLSGVIQSMPDQSALQRNEDIRNVPLKYSPFVRQANAESEDYGKIRGYFNPNAFDERMDNIIQSIKSRQGSGGGFSWMPGGRESWYMSQAILDGIAQLHHLTKLSISENWINRLNQFCEQSLQDEYVRHKKYNSKGVSNLVLRYLRSKDILYPEQSWNQYDNYFWKLLKLNWTDQSIANQVVIGQILKRKFPNDPLLLDIKKSFDERMIDGGDRGLFWKYNIGSRYSDRAIYVHSQIMDWYHAMEDYGKIDGMMTYLIQNKRTNAWDNKMSSVQAIYSILDCYGGDHKVLSKTVPIEIMINENDVKLSENVALGSRAIILDNDLKSDDRISITNSNDHIAWVNVYRKYTDSYENVKSKVQDELSIKRTWWIKNQLSTWEPLKSAQVVQKGDKILVRFELKADRDFEYVSLKDSRPAGFEPGVGLSGYQWKNGLTYYQAIKDTRVDFFINFLARGTHVLEYELQATHAGDYVSGIAQLECMYAPEFKAHSSGSRVTVN